MALNCLSNLPKVTQLGSSGGRPFSSIVELFLRLGTGGLVKRREKENPIYPEAEMIKDHSLQ